MYFVARSECTQDAMRWIVEASQLQIPPGVVEPYLETDIGNGEVFIWHHAEADGVQVYKQRYGIYMLCVLND